MRRATIRVRLTGLYGALLLLAGAALLGVTYLLVQEILDAGLPQYASEIERLSEQFKAQGRPGGQWAAAFNAERERFLSATLDALLVRGGVALAAVALVAGAAAWLLAGRALRPLQRITETARRIATAGRAGGGLHERIGLAGPRDEVKELADTFDAMLERLDRSFDSQRRFVANASHEIRTPLALNRALVELAVTRPDAPEEIRRLGESLLVVNERHERLIDGLLTLADSERPVTERSPVDLAEVAEHVLQLMAAAAEAKVAVRSTIGAALTSGDPVLLERLTQNLVENAIRHNLPADGWLSVETSTADGGALLVVCNSGPAVPRYEIETLFLPFRRLHGERIGRDRSFGLGLSIVRAVATAHGGNVAAEPQPDGGLTVQVTLPPRPSPLADADPPAAATR
jgi:signal transduction histidine kinase